MLVNIVLSCSLSQLIYSLFLSLIKTITASQKKAITEEMCGKYFFTAIESLLVCLAKGFSFCEYAILLQ